MGFREGPIAGIGAPSFFDGGSWGKVSYFVHYVPAFDFKDHFTQIKLAMTKAVIVSIFKSLGKLYRNIVDELHVGARHLVGQVQVHLPYVREDRATIIGFNEGEVTLALQVDEAVECSAEIRVGRYINPPRDVFIVRYLPDYEVALEVLMVDYVMSVAENMLNNSLAIEKALAQPKDTIKFSLLFDTFFALPLFLNAFLFATHCSGHSRRNLRNLVVWYHHVFLFIYRIFKLF